MRVPGLEPGAFWFVAKRSIQLGYIRIGAPKYSIIGPYVKGFCLKILKELLNLRCKF